MIYSDECKWCREDFNISYYNQLAAEFRLVTDEERKLSPEAYDALAKSVAEFTEERCISCDDVFQFEKMLTRLRSTERLRMQIGVLRERYKALVGEVRFNAYLATAAKEHDPDPLLRSDIEFLLEALHQIYTLMPSRERMRGMLIERAAFVMLGCMLVFSVLGMVLRYLNDREIFPLVLTIIFGSIGGYIGMVRRLQDIPANNDPIANFLDLRYGKVSVVLAPLNGAVFAVVLLLLFVSGIVKGTIFPEFDTALKPGDFFVSLSLKNLESYAQLLFWSFLAGFAERLVPDTLDRIVARKQLETAVQPQPAGGGAPGGTVLGKGLAIMKGKPAG